ncbi:hypothetical protein BT63DRAFT_421150 [Microthyrium microscopicum]|uniref:Uncharacterized protein n=1 Tax=Microthyrium microscopicum TaxID=703497 RepID=A0A6A6UL04_9PEZI|nr:hypothetical protein BT63DRAFT_421150 [Microthyrium microscopicum]
MAKRCSTARYLGVARVPGISWMLNERGIANIAHTKSNKEIASTWKLLPEVWGLVYQLEDTDESMIHQRHRTQTQPRWFKTHYAADFWPAANFQPLNLTHKLPAVDVQQTPVRNVNVTTYYQELFGLSTPSKEYRDRMHQGVRDALSLGVPRAYIEQAIREWIYGTKEKVKYDIPNTRRTRRH